MNIVTAVKTCFRKSFDWTGRAGQAEFWLFTLAWVLALLVVFFMLGSLPTGPTGEPPLAAVFIALALYLGPLPASLAAAARRLHDTRRSAVWLLTGLVPFVGPVIQVVLLALPGTVGANEYGPDPRGASPFITRPDGARLQPGTGIAP